MALKNIAILISGSGTNAQAIIDGVSKGEIKNARVCIVISDREGAYGIQRAKDAGIKAMTINKRSFEKKEAFYNELYRALQESQADYVVLAGFLSIVPETIVKEYQGRMINIHPSLIPQYSGIGFYGEKVHRAVIANKEKVSGATVHLVEAGVDTGKILLQKEVPVKANDTPEILAKRVLKVEHELLVEALKQLIDNGEDI